MIIALTGPSKSGKDAAARYLCEAWESAPPFPVPVPKPAPWVRNGTMVPGGPVIMERHYTARTIALADPLRAAADALGVPADLVRGRKDEPRVEFNGGTGRDLLLELGRATRAWCGDDHFARLGVERARDAESLHAGRLVVVTDVRREVEARLLLEAGARLLYVDRGIDPATDALYGPQHVAIQALRPATLSNRGTLADLTVACRAVVDALRAEVRS